MKLELEVLACTSIKRKKPWPKTAFIGEVQESLFLLDEQRLSVLYIPSGKTKRKIPKLHPMLSNVAVLTHTKNGHFIGGLLSSGDLFIWHKDSDLIKHIKGLPEFKQNVNPTKPVDGGIEEIPPQVLIKPFLSISDDGTKILLVLNNSKPFVWELDPGFSIFGSRQQTHLPGTWTTIMAAVDSLVPGPECKETALGMSWFLAEDQYGLSCTCSIVFYQGDNLVVTSLMLKWFEANQIANWSSPVFHVDWTTRQYPVADISGGRAQPVNSHGALVTRVSHDGQLTCIAVNQTNSHDNRVLFMSPTTGVNVVSNLRGCGAREATSNHYRTYWVLDMCWSCDDLLVACMLGQGLLCVLTRLGEPAMLQTFGSSIEMGPKPFLPLHPLVIVSSRKQKREDLSLSDSMREAADPMRQRFSICAHPRLPMLVCSDGYMVTVLQVPGQPTCLSLIKGLCLEANHHLKRVREQGEIKSAYFDSLKRAKSSASDSKLQRKSSLKQPKNSGSQTRTGLLASKKLARQTRFSETEQALYEFECMPSEVGSLAEYDSDDGGGGARGGGGGSTPQVNVFSEGKIDFGDLGNLNTTLDYQRAGTSLDEDLTVAERIARTQIALMHAWNLAASHQGLWTLEHETIADNIAENVVQLFAVLLYAQPKTLKEIGSTVSAILDHMHQSSPKKINKRLVLVLRLFKSILQTLRFDTKSRHLMVCATKFTNSTVAMLLRNESLATAEARSRTLHGCYIILKYAESSLETIYASLPDTQPYSNISLYDTPVPQNDMYGPAVFVYTAAPRQGLDAVARGGTEDGSEDGDVSGAKAKGEAVEGALNVTQDVSGVVSVQLTGVKRLGVAWLVLYKGAVESYKLARHRNRTASAEDPSIKTPKSEIRKTWALILLLQSKIHALGLALPSNTKSPLTQAEAALIEGNQEGSKEFILQEISSTPTLKLTGEKGSRLLLSMLYLLLQQHQLRSALELTEFLLRQSDVKKAVMMSQQDTSTRLSLLSLLQQMPSKRKCAPEAVIRARAVRHVVQSMARLMAAYFGNKPLFVYPAHNVKKLPPLHVAYSMENERVVALRRDDVTSAVIDAGLGEAWSSDKAIEYLLLCGALPEAVWLARAVGDWKTALLIAVTTEQHRQLAPALYAKKKKCHLPTELQSSEILKERLSLIIGPASEKGTVTLSMDDTSHIDSLTNSLNDFLLAGSLCDLDLVPWLLGNLIGRLKSLAGEFCVMVPENLYLPAPPLYCPQPTPTNKARIPGDVLEEVERRHAVASVLQLILLVLTSSYCTLPAARWYTQQVLEAYTRAGRIYKHRDEEVDIKVLQESFLNNASPFQGYEKSDSIHAVLESFREMTGVMWMLHCRDKLSLALRKKSILAEKRCKKTSVVTEEAWSQHCRSALTWARHMMPFRHFLPADADLDLCSVLFSLVIELPPSEESAKILAEYFHSGDELHPDIQDKMKWLKKDWKRLQLTDRPHGVTLSIYYEKIAEKYEKLVRKKKKTFGAYDEFVFVCKDESESSIEEDTTLYIGSRPFESDIGFLKFLDEFFAVSFNKLLDQEAENQGHTSKPLLKRYSDAIRITELNSVVHKAVSSFQHKQITSDAINTSRSRNNSPVLQRRSRTVSRTPSGGNMSDFRTSPRSRRGLMRSNSVAEVNRDVTRVRGDDVIRGIPPHSPRPLRRANSHTQLENGDDFRPITPITPRGADALNASQLGISNSKHKTSTPRRPKGKKTTIDQYAHELENAQSLESIATSVATCDLVDDPLATPVLEPWMLENMVFEERYQPLESLLDWLNRWVNRNHDFGEFDNKRHNGKRASVTRQQSVMRIRVPPRLMLYSVWQLENNFYKDLTKNTDSDGHARVVDNDVTSRMKVYGESEDTYEELSELDAPGGSGSGRGAASEEVYGARYPQPLSHAEKQRLRRSPNRHRDDILKDEEIPTKDVPSYSYEQPKTKKSSKKKQKRRNPGEHVIDESTTTQSDDASIHAHRSRHKYTRKPDVAKPAKSNLGELQSESSKESEKESDITFDDYAFKTEIEKKAKNRRHKDSSSGKKSRRLKEYDPDYDVINTDSLPDDVTMPRLTDAQRVEARRRKKISLRHKTLDVLLNERYVYDVGLGNTNQNNRNVSGASESHHVSGTSDSSTLVGEEETGSERNSPPPGTAAARGSESEVGLQLSRAVTERLKDGALGAEASEVIRTLSSVIDEEIDKTLPLLEEEQHKQQQQQREVQQKSMGSAICPSKEGNPPKRSREISQPLVVSHTSDLEEALNSALNMPAGRDNAQARTLSPQNTSGTLPFGSGLTNRSDASTIAEELRTVVRNELKKLVEAQHQGILAMLGTFDENGTPTHGSQSKPRSAVKKTTSFSDKHQIFHPDDDIIKPQQECTVMTAQRVGQAPHPAQFSRGSLRHSNHSNSSKHHHSNDDSDSLALSTDTEIDVTPLPSDELNTERSAGDKPLTISQLTPHGEASRKQALKELKDLSNKHHGGSHGHKHHKHHSPARGKENHPFVPTGTYTAGTLNDTGQFGTGQMPPMGWMPLLHIPPDKPQTGTRFPPIPQGWGPDQPPHTVPPQQSQSLPFMPLLHANYPHQQQHPNYFRYEIPERDTPSSSGPSGPSAGEVMSTPPPLLHADWSNTPFMHMRDEHAVPRLVPPAELLAYEARKYNTHGLRKQQLQSEINEALRGAAAQNQEPRLGAKLLKADMEPFAERDERDNEARQRRRNIKLTKPSDRKKKKKRSRDQHMDSGQENSQLEASQEMSVASDLSRTQDSIQPETAVKVHAEIRTSTKVKVKASGTADSSTDAELDADAPLHLHHGYAITPGMFDEYVDKDDELGTDAQNFARDQMHAQKLVKEQESKVNQKMRSPRKRNVAVETDDVMHDKGTTLTKDTGTQPVAEAIARFYRSKTGQELASILPPDIYMGLRFPDPKEAKEGADVSGTRGFLNVVDINSADMLAEIAEALPEREAHELVPQAVDMNGRPIQPHPRMSGEYRKSSPRRGAQSPTAGRRSPSADRRSPSPRRPGPDRVTADLLGHENHSAVAGALAGYGSRVTTRDAIRRRLGDMDTQIDAIETMAQNIEQDFSTTKLLLNTIDQLGESILPTAERYPTPRVTHTDYNSPRAGSQPSTRRSKERASLESRLADVRRSLESEKLGVSGLSGVSEILGEIVAAGELEPEELGFTQKEANYMAQKYLNSARSGEFGSTADLEEIYKKKTPRRMNTRSEAERKELQQWMRAKHAERMRTYINERAELREREANPFATQPKLMTTQDKNLEEARKTRKSNKLERERGFTKEREREATYLMRDILEDKLEDKLPSEPSPRTARSERPLSARTPKSSQRTSTPKKPTSARAASASPRRHMTSGVSPQRPPVQRDNYLYGNASSQLRPNTASTVQRLSRIDSRNQTRSTFAPTRSDHSPMAPKKSLEFSGENLVHVYQSYEEVSVAEDQGHDVEVDLHKMDREAVVNTVPTAQDAYQRDSESEPRAATKPYKPKPYTELVKMQHPEKIRKERDRSHQPVAYVDRLSQMSSTYTTPRSQADSEREQSMIRGTKRPAGVSKAHERHAPRTVKTYQQRLSELRNASRTYDTPIVPRAHHARAAPQPLPATSAAVKPRHTPKTYAEQLQALQPPKELYRSGEGGVMSRHVKKAHKPAHEPKTYTQQLQELQPGPKARLSSEYYVDERRMTSVRAAMRSRPYASPYAQDNESVVSAWSVSDKVHELLYNPEDASLLEPSASLGTTDLDITEAADLAMRYVDQVDPRDLDDVMSLAGSDITAIIDWDQVDELIADIH